MFRILNSRANLASKLSPARLQILSAHPYVTGERYQGYVTFYHPEDLFGFVVREDLPEREYHFHATDMQVANIPRVREFTQVEFSLTAGRGGNYMARDVTALNGHPIDFHHPNLRLQKHERTLRLSELGNEAERHRGVVVTSHDKGGMIVPDRLNYDAVGFQLEEIQSTGTTSVPRFCEVEFSVRHGRTRDQAVCITRPGGGLITTERRVLGARRRAVGNMYFSTDRAAKIPYEFSQDRRRGYISSYNADKLFGFLVDLDDPSKTVFVHIDDGHMFGKRAFRRFQQVEYYLAKDVDGREKALHITGPNQTVLRYNSANMYMPRDQLTEKYAPDGTSRHQGVVVKTTASRGEPGNTFGIIRPDDSGYDNVLFFKNMVNAVGHRTLDRGDAVEFSLEQFESEEGEERTNTSNITMPGGSPFVTEGGSYGAYLRTRLDKAIPQSELPEVPVTGEKQSGWVSTWGRDFCTIEPEAPEGERYRKVTFTIDDCEIPDNVDKEKAFVRAGYPVEFTVSEAEAPAGEDEEGESPSVFTQKATGITSINSAILETRQRFDREYQDFAQERETDGFVQTMEL